MIIVTATMWPGGNQMESFELLHASLTCQSDAEAMDNLLLPQSYFSHVTVRPALRYGILGYDADIAIRDHKHSDGFVPLVMAALGAAQQEESSDGLTLPPATVLKRLSLVDAAEFERLIRSGGAGG